MLKHCLFASAACLPWVAEANVVSLSPEYFVEVEGFSYSPAMPIVQLMDDLQGPSVKQGDYAFSSNWVETGIRTRHFSVSVVERMEFYSTFTNDTLRMLHEQKNDIINTRETPYTVDLYGFFFKARGTKVKLPVFQSQQLTLSIAGTYYEAREMQQGIIQGSVSSGGDVQGYLDLDYSYTSDVFFNREPGDVNGYGYSLDFEGRWALNDSTHFSFSARDLKSQIKWRNQQHTLASSTTDTIQYSNDGKINARPVLEWLESDQTVVQQLPRYYDVSLSRVLNSQWAVGAMLERYENINILGLEASYQLHASHRIAGYYSPNHGSLGARYDTKRMYFSISSDRTNWNKVHNLSFSLGVNMPLTY